MEKRYYVVEPAVAGGLGPETEMDTSFHPPIVSRLNYEFEGWVGDSILESFPCYIVTDRCKRAFESGRFSGCAYAVVNVTTSDVFEELHPGRSLPLFHWLKVDGVAGDDHFGISSNYSLVISETVLAVLRMFNLRECDVEPFTSS